MNFLPVKGIISAAGTLNIDQVSARKCTADYGNRRECSAIGWRAVFLVVFLLLLGFFFKLLCTLSSLAGNTPNREGKGGLVTSRTTTCAGGMQ